MSNEQDLRPAEKVRLTLTAPALRRLIGDDAELELQLRAAAIKEILKAHEKFVLDGVEDAVKRCQERLIGVKLSSGTVSLSQEAKAAVYTATKAGLVTAITGAVRNVISQQKDIIEAAVAAQVARQVDKRVTEIIEERVQRALKAATSQLG